MTITIAHLFPQLLNLYGDKGNIATLRSRLERRGIEVEIIEYCPEDTIAYEKSDIILLGGGSDREQQAVCQRLLRDRDSLFSYTEDSGVLLALCGGFPMLGEQFPVGEETAEGLHLLNITTCQGNNRLIGNVVLESELTGGTIVGFENHSTHTDIGAYAPLGKVMAGHGNDGESGWEGVVYKNIIATNLHGPLLPKNPALADNILSRALERKYGATVLAPLDDELEKQAHSFVVEHYANK